MKSCDVCDFLPTIKLEYTFIDTEYWTANLRNTDQTLLGTSFITAKRHVPELDYLTPEEDRDLILIRNALFGAIRRSFSPVTFNTSCLKNNAFTDPLTIPAEATHVHWHVKPRYRPGVTPVNGEQFYDPMPGRYLELSSYIRHEPSEATAKQIAEIIRSNL